MRHPIAQVATKKTGFYLSQLRLDQLLGIENEQVAWVACFRSRKRRMLLHKCLHRFRVSGFGFRV